MQTFGPSRSADLDYGQFVPTRQRQLPTGSSKGVSVVPLIVGDTKRRVALTNTLFKRGIDVQPILYPAVRARAVRLRFFISNTHTEGQIRRTIGIVDEFQNESVLKRGKIISTLQASSSENLSIPRSGSSAIHAGWPPNRSHSSS